MSGENNKTSNQSKKSTGFTFNSLKPETRAFWERDLACNKVTPPNNNNQNKRIIITYSRGKNSEDKHINQTPSQSATQAKTSRGFTPQSEIDRATFWNPSVRPLECNKVRPNSKTTIAIPGGACS